MQFSPIHWLSLLSLDFSVLHSLLFSLRCIISTPANSLTFCESFFVVFVLDFLTWLPSLVSLSLVAGGVVIPEYIAFAQLCLLSQVVFHPISQVIFLKDIRITLKESFCCVKHNALAPSPPWRGEQGHKTVTSTPWPRDTFTVQERSIVLFVDQWKHAVLPFFITHTPINMSNHYGGVHLSILGSPCYHLASCIIVCNVIKKYNRFSMVEESM